MYLSSLNIKLFHNNATKTDSWELIFTDGFAGFGRWVNLVTFLTLAFVTAYLVDADLAAGVRVGTLIDIWYEEGEQ